MNRVYSPAGAVPIGRQIVDTNRWIDNSQDVAPDVKPLQFITDEEVNPGRPASNYLGLIPTAPLGARAWWDPGTQQYADPVASDLGLNCDTVVQKSDEDLKKAVRMYFQDLGSRTNNRSSTDTTSDLNGTSFQATPQPVDDNSKKIFGHPAVEIIVARIRYECWVERNMKRLRWERDRAIAKAQEVNTSLANVTADKTNLTNRLNRANTHIQQLNDQVAALTGQLQGMTASRDQCTAALAQAQAQGQQLTTQGQQLQQQLAAMTAERDACKTAAEQKDQQLAAANGQLSTLQGQVTTLQSQVADAHNQNSLLQPQNQQNMVNTLHAELTAAQQQLVAAQQQAQQQLAACQAQPKGISPMIAIGGAVLAGGAAFFIGKK